MWRIETKPAKHAQFPTKKKSIDDDEMPEDHQAAACDLGAIPYTHYAFRERSPPIGGANRESTKQTDTPYDHHQFD